VLLLFCVSFHFSSNYNTSLDAQTSFVGPVKKGSLFSPAVACPHSYVDTVVTVAHHGAYMYANPPSSS
jgi:hypothetical protein